MYQLARTSAALSGQVQWNFILGTTASGLGVTNFSLSPISPYIPFDYKFDEDILNYTHLENIKKLHKKIGGSFFKSPVNPKFDTGYPIVVDSKEDMEDSHDATYEMRLYRPSYQIFNRQFAIFCPLWIDDENFDVNELEFILEVMTYKKETYRDENGEDKVRYVDNTIIRKSISPNNEIISYIEKYIKDTKNNQDLLYLDFKKSQAWIKGVDVESGLPRVQDTSYIISNLLERERPLLEFDNMLLSQFSSHSMIASQLFNFNFIFDVNDLLILTAKNSLDFNEFNAKVNVKYKGEVVEIKDLYTNYEYIPKYSTKTQSYTNTNCLDYLQDNACVELLNKNKMSQPNFHWCLLDNPEYQFQLYNGFSPYYDNNKSATGFYFNMPDIWSKNYGDKKNNLAWMKIYIPEEGFRNPLTPQVYEGPATDILSKLANEKIVGYKYIQDTNWFGSLKLSDKLIPNIDWVTFNANVKSDIENFADVNIISIDKIIDVIDANDIEKIEIKELSVLFISTKETGFNNLVDFTKSYGFMGEFYNSDIYICCSINKRNPNSVDDYERSINLYIFHKGIVTKTTDDFCYKNFINNDFGKLAYTTTLLEFIQSILKSVEQPTFVFYHKSIQSNVVNKPEYASPKQLRVETNNDTYNQPSEITYTKDDDMFTYLIRYDGKLYPMFLGLDEPELFNYSYSIKQLVKGGDDFDYYNDMMWTKFPGNFPSICYTPRDIDVETIMRYPKNEETGGVKMMGNEYEYKWIEYSWFQKNKFYNLNPSFEITTEASELNEEDILKLFLNYYNDKLKNSQFRVVSEEDVEKHIYPLYKVDYSFDYNWYNKNELIEDKKYKYTIKYTLK